MANGKPVFGKKHELIVSDFAQRWIGHPDPHIDITIMPLVPLINFLKEKNIEIFFQAITSELIPTDKDYNEAIDVIEDVIFLGYPNGIYDSVNLLPVIRKGLTATPIMVNFEGKPIFLIDASVFPGSSGSPVFLANRGLFPPKSGNSMVLMSNRFYFLGIVSSVYIRKEENEIKIVDIPTTQKEIVETTQMIDLGTVFKSSIILEMTKCYLQENGLLSGN